MLVVEPYGYVLSATDFPLQIQVVDSEANADDI
jgi:hypothetical protein